MAASCSSTESIDAQLVSPSASSFEMMPLVNVNSGSPRGNPAAYTSMPVLRSSCVPVERRQRVVLVDVDQREVVALRHAEHGGVVALVGVAADEDLEGRGAGDDVVVRDRQAVVADDETGAAAAAIGEPDLGITDRADRLDLDDRRLDRIDASGFRLGVGDGVIGGFSVSRRVLRSSVSATVTSVSGAAVSSDASSEPPPPPHAASPIAASAITANERCPSRCFMAGESSAWPSRDAFWDQIGTVDPASGCRGDHSSVA